jgi:DNA-binding beta-propeller fold protein YncE
VDPVAVVPAGDAVFIADAGARKIYRRDAGGLLTTIAGTGDVGQAVLGVPALQSPITPAALLRRTDGTLVVVEASPERVRILEITPEGVIVSLTEAAGIAVTSEGDLLLTMDSLGRVVLAGTFGIAVENPLLLSGDLPGFSVFQFSAEFVAIASESPTTVIAFNAGELQRITLDFGALSAIATTIDKGRFNEDGRAVAVSAEGIFVGGASDGEQLLRTNDTLALVVPGGPGRTGDGGPANGATIADPAALIVDDVGRLLIVDSGSGTIRRVGPAPSRVIETIAGDLQPAGGLVAGGAAGRLLHVDLTSPGGVTVVVGQPSPSPSPVAGPGGLTPARHLPLLPATTAFGFDPLDPIGPALKVVGERRVHRIDTTAAPTAWEASVNPPLNILLGASHIARVDADHIAVTDRAEHCVRRLRADTLALVDVLFGTCGSAGAFAGLVRDPGALVVDAEDGTVYLADTGNHRVLRRDPGGEVDVVIGDGSPSSAGQGSPARDFPLQSPGQLALDASGNLFIASTTTVRLVANVDGDANADGDDFVSTIYGRDNRDAFPQRDSRCLAGLVLDEAADRLIVADACGGFLVALDLVEVP